MRLQISKSANAESFYIVESVYEGNGKRTNRIVETLGTLPQVKKRAGDMDPYEWAKAYAKELTQKKNEGKEPPVIAKYAPGKQIPKDSPTLFNGGYLFLQKIYYELGLNRICDEISDKYRFTYDLNSILSRLIYARVLSPSSKLSSLEYSGTLLEKPNFELQHIYRALEVISKENDFIQAALYKNSRRVSKRNDKVLYYDCTNFFFEIEAEDDLRKYGKSKEHRPNPIVQMGLFLDGDGIPLAFSIFPGNKNEQPSLKPLEKKIIKDFGNSSFVVCTDAGLSGTPNRKFNDKMGRAFITTQSVKKMQSFLHDWVFDDTGWMLHQGGKNKTYNISQLKEDAKLMEKYKNEVFYKERWINEDGLEQRIIVSFSVKSMLYQRNIRMRQYQRASSMLENPGGIKRKSQNDPKRFIKETAATKDGEIASKKSYELNEELFLSESQYDGYYAVATNLEDDAEQIVRINKNRWEIEAAFRIMKSEFEARPVYLSREDRIRAHFTTCYLALTVFKYLEKRIDGDFSSGDIIETLREMKFQCIPKSGYVPVYTRTDLTDALHDAFDFRTDYEIVTNKTFKGIFKKTKERRRAQNKTDE